MECLPLSLPPEPEAHDKVFDNNPGRIGISKCWFLRRGENRSTRRKTSRSKDEKQQQTQPTYDAESENRTRATLVGGECSHHCDIPAPLLSPPPPTTPLPAAIFLPYLFGLHYSSQSSMSQTHSICSRR